MFLLRYISQVETNGVGIRRELQSREDELHRLECRLSELEIEVARGYFKSAIEEGNATEAEKAIRAIFLNENALIENCPG